MNITLSEWEKRALDLKSEIEKRIPIVTVKRMHNNHDLTIITDDCSGTIGLEIDGGDNCLRVEAQIGSAKPPTGKLSQVEASLANYRGVLDALHYAIAQTDSMRIFPDGKCPCDWCSGKGISCGTKCKKCNGEGVR